MLKRLIPYYKDHKNLFLFDMVCALFLSAVDLAFPFVTRLFMNDYIPNSNTRAMITAGIIMLALILIRCACNYFVLFWGHIMGSRIERDIRRDLFAKFQTLNFSYFDENQTGRIMSRLVGDLREIAEMTHHAPEDLFISFVMFIGTFILLMNINVTLTLILVPIILLVVVYSVRLRKRRVRAQEQVKETQSDINAQIESSISGIRLMKSFTNEAKELDKFDKNNEKYYKSWFEQYNLMGWFHGINTLLLDIASLVLLVVGGFLVLNSQMNIGDMTAFFLYLSYLTQPIRKVIQLMEQLEAGMAGFQRFCDVMDIEPEIQSPENGVQLTEPKGKIAFEDVTFSYPTSEADVLKDFTLTIEPGQKVALVGESGVGKSTISNLIPRFYDVTKGRILVDDVDVKAYDLPSLRQSIGQVQQDVFIFFDNILENIRYGRPDATDAEVFEAAKKANIHDFILSLENGYETQVGERGVKLSGGQKQRIAIARVFLKNPRILILDEATSALDNITEALIQKALDELAKGRTTITIAHRLSTIKNADQIIVLNDAGIAEVGTHDKLIGSNGYYADLYSAAGS